MNLLFIVPSTFPQRGGVERVSFLLARELHERGINCFSLSLHCAELNLESKYKANCKYVANSNIILQCVQQHHIDIVINQLPMVGSIVSELSKLKYAKIISCFHGSPTFYRDNLRIELTYPFFSVRKLRAILKRCLLLVYEPYGRIFRKAYNESSAFLLLSARNIEIFKNEYKFISDKKFYSIENPLSFNEYFEDSYEAKERIVLIVSRLSDRDKRISLLLKVWAEIENKEETESWRLVIVGGGNDQDSLCQLAQNLSLKKCSFEGPRKNVIDYYRRASIFIFASSNEGWGMVLTEAMQMGCVPIAFGTYSALLDIIKNGENGIIVEEGNIPKYVEELLSLMRDTARREQMAKNAVSYSKQFAIGTIADKWVHLFKKIMG